MTNKYLITTIIPVYNTYKYFKKCLCSIVEQCYKELDIIIIDDGSYDFSTALCDELSFSDCRVLTIHSKNCGVSKARNIGLEISRGEIINFVDSDDYLENDAFEYLTKEIQEKKCDIISYDYFVDSVNEEKRRYHKKDMYGLIDMPLCLELVMKYDPFVVNKFFLKKLIYRKYDRKVIKFKENIYRGEDTFFVSEILDNAKAIYFFNKPLYHYVQSENSATRGVFRKNQLSGLKLQELYKQFYVKYPYLKKEIGKWLPNLYITLYRDMFLYGKDCKNEMTNLVKDYRENYKEITDCNKTKKEWTKFTVFYVSPRLYCLISKLINRL